MNYDDLHLLIEGATYLFKNVIDNKFELEPLTIVKKIDQALAVRGPQNGLFGPSITWISNEDFANKYNLIERLPENEPRVRID